MTKTGRPTNDPKNLMLRVRISTKTKKQIEEICIITKSTISEVIRDYINQMYGQLKK